MVVCVIADDLDDRLEDDDFDLIEENLGVRVERVSHKYFFLHWILDKSK